jgi:GNAT superfamily N-acetyltransferase
MNGGAHRPHRFQVAGFERDPFLFEPRNPPYYPALFEACGFRRLHGWQSFDLTHEELAGIRALLDAGTSAAREDGRYRIELVEPRDTGAALARLHPLLDGIWGGHVGYTSLDLEEFAEVFGGVLAVITRRHMGVLVDRASGRDVGCAFMYPDWIEEVRALRGDASGWGAWLASGRRPRRAILHTTAVLPEARGTGGAYLLVAQGIQHLLEDGYEQLTVALVDEDWKLFRKVAAPTRAYALFAREIG